MLFDTNTSYEITAITLGIIAIVIAIVAFARQEKWNKRVERMTKEMSDYNQHHKKIEDSIKDRSLKSLQRRLGLIKHHFETMMSELSKQPNIEKLNDLIYSVGYGKVLRTNSKGLQILADNLKFFILSSFHIEIEALSSSLYRLADLDNVKPFPESYELWLEWENNAMKILNELQTKASDELKTIKN